MVYPDTLIPSPSVTYALPVIVPPRPWLERTEERRDYRRDGKKEGMDFHRSSYSTLLNAVSIRVFVVLQVTQRDPSSTLIFDYSGPICI